MSHGPLARHPTASPVTSTPRQPGTSRPSRPALPGHPHSPQNPAVPWLSLPPSNWYSRPSPGFHLPLGESTVRHYPALLSPRSQAIPLPSEPHPPTASPGDRHSPPSRDLPPSRPSWTRFHFVTRKLTSSVVLKAVCRDLSCPEPISVSHDGCLVKMTEACPVRYAVWPLTFVYTMHKLHGIDTKEHWTRRTEARQQHRQPSMQARHGWFYR